MFEKSSKESSSNQTSGLSSGAYYKREITFSKEIATSQKMQQKIEKKLMFTLAKGFQKKPQKTARLTFGGFSNDNNHLIHSYSPNKKQMSMVMDSNNFIDITENEYQNMCSNVIQRVN